MRRGRGSSSAESCAWSSRLTPPRSRVCSSTTPAARKSRPRSRRSSTLREPSSEVAAAPLTRNRSTSSQRVRLTSSLPGARARQQEHLGRCWAARPRKLEVRTDGHADDARVRCRPEPQAAYHIQHAALHAWIAAYLSVRARLRSRSLSAAIVNVTTILPCGHMSEGQRTSRGASGSTRANRMIRV